MQAFIRGDASLPPDLVRFGGHAEDVQAALRLIALSPANMALCLGAEQLVFYNDACAALIGPHHPASMGQPLALGWPEMARHIGQFIERVYTSGQPLSKRYQPLDVGLSSDGGPSFADLALSPLCAKDGTILGVLCAITPTTAMIRGAEALRASEARFREIVGDIASMGLCTFDERGQILGANDRFAQLLDRPLAQIEGLNLNSLIFGPDQKRFAVSPPSNGSPVHQELRYLRPDGGMIWVSQTVGALGGRGGAACLIARDISQSRRVEAEMHHAQALFEGCRDAVMTVDAQLEILSANPAAAALLGCENGALGGRHLREFLSPDGAAEELDFLSAVFKGEIPPLYEAVRRRHDGQPVAVAVALSPVRDAQGAVIAASLVARDMSTRADTHRLQAVLMREMKHRVKNILASVLVIARQTFAHTKIPETAVFNERVFALARAQDLLTRDEREAAELNRLIGDLTAPFPAEKFCVSGPEVVVSADTVMSLTLALHELTTNTMKYGALSVGTGRVDITWELHTTPEGGVLVDLNWVERGGPPVVAPERRGFGTTLIRDVLAAELRARVSLDYPVEGVRFRAIFAPGK